MDRYDFYTERYSKRSELGNEIYKSWATKNLNKNLAEADCIIFPSNWKKMSQKDLYSEVKKIVNHCDPKKLEKIKNENEKEFPKGSMKLLHSVNALSYLCLCERIFEILCKKEISIFERVKRFISSEMKESKSTFLHFYVILLRNLFFFYNNNALPPLKVFDRKKNKKVIKLLMKLATLNYRDEKMKEKKWKKSEIKGPNLKGKAVSLELYTKRVMISLSIQSLMIILKRNNRFNYNLFFNKCKDFVEMFTIKKYIENTLLYLLSEDTVHQRTFLMFWMKIFEFEPAKYAKYFINEELFDCFVKMLDENKHKVYLDNTVEGDMKDFLLLLKILGIYSSEYSGNTDFILRSKTYLKTIIKLFIDIEEGRDDIIGVIKKECSVVLSGTFLYLKANNNQLLYRYKSLFVRMLDVKRFKKCGTLVQNNIMRMCYGVVNSSKNARDFLNLFRNNILKIFDYCFLELVDLKKKKEIITDHAMISLFRHLPLIIFQYFIVDSTYNKFLKSLFFREGKHLLKEMFYLYYKVPPRVKANYASVIASVVLYLPNESKVFFNKFETDPLINVSSFRESLTYFFETDKQLRKVSYVRALTIIEYYILDMEPLNEPVFKDFIKKSTHFQFSRNPDVNKTYKNCGYCKKESAKFNCSRCKSVYYCDRKCQKRDWKIHKTECIPFL